MITLHACLVAILENAVEACLADKSREAHRISFRASSASAEDNLIVIADDGPGMTDEVREKLFDLFYSSKGSKGTGLGLFLAHRAVAQHGGSIDVSSDRMVTTWRDLPLSRVMALPIFLRNSLRIKGLSAPLWSSRSRLFN